MKYFCITFYKKGTEQEPYWEVFGTRKEDVSLGTYKTEEEAREEAFSYCVPVFKGSDCGKYVSIVRNKKMIANLVN